MSKIWIPGGGSSVDLDVITAEAGDILASKVIVDKDGNPLVGTMPNNGAWSSSNLAAGASVGIPLGYHDGKGKVIAKDLASQTPGNLASNKILANYYGYSNGVKVTGNIASQGALTLKPGKTAKTGSVSGKYMTGNITVPAVSIAANVIKKGTRITFPDGSYVDGTFEGYVASPTDLYYKGNNPAGFSFGTTEVDNIQYGSATFESGCIRITGKRSVNYLALMETLKSGKQYNLNGYSKLNIEYKPNFDNTSGVHFLYLDLYTNYSDSEKYGSFQLKIETATEGVTITKSITFSAPATKYIALRTQRIDDMEVYRIWLS